MNPLFRFLKPQHSLFPLFLELQEAYTRILKPPKEVIDKLANQMSSVSIMLERCLKRVEWNRQEVWRNANATLAKKVNEASVAGMSFEYVC